MSRTFFIALVVSLFALAGHCLAESPAEFAHRFCIEEESFQDRGVPNGREALKWEIVLGTELIQSIREANHAVDLWREAHRHAKESLMIPHIYGNLFMGFDDGPVSTSVGKVSHRSGRIVVELCREHQEGSQTDSWTDYLILDRDAAGWVVADLETHYYGSILGCLREFQDRVSQSTKSS